MMRSLPLSSWLSGRHLYPQPSVYAVLFYFIEPSGLGLLVYGDRVPRSLRGATPLHQLRIRVTWRIRIQNGSG
jgi:hypothetical protein